MDTLRRSFATSMLEAGVDVLTISKLLGHSSFVTTMIHLHVRRQHFRSLAQSHRLAAGAAVPEMGGGESLAIDLAARAATDDDAAARRERGHARDHGGHAHGRTAIAGSQDFGAKAADETLRKTGQFQPAAQLAPHTWNQRLGHHPHIHALVPGGGPSLDAGNGSTVATRLNRVAGNRSW